MSCGALAPAASVVSVHRDFGPPPSRRLEPTASAPAVLSCSASPSPRLDRVLLTSVGDFRIVSSFSKRSTRLGGHKSRISVFCRRIPSLAGQGSHVICTHSNSSGGDAYRCAILMLCHLPHHRRCLHGSPNQRRYVAPARLQACHLASHLLVPCRNLAIPISRSAARPNAGASPGAILRSHEAQACTYGPRRRVIWQWSFLMPWYVIPTLEMFDRRSDHISPTLHSVAKDRTAAAYIFHSPALEHDSAIKWRRSRAPNCRCPGESTAALERLHSLSHCNGGIHPQVATALRAEIHPVATVAFSPWANMERRTFSANACMSPGRSHPRFAMHPPPPASG